MRASDDHLDRMIGNIERRAGRLAVQWREVARHDRRLLEENTAMLLHLIEELNSALDHSPERY
jgi:hypothetical protein